MGMGMGAMRGVHRNMVRDRDVLKHDLARGIGRRVLEFAAPYRKILSLFLVLIIADALIGVTNPLLFREIINNGMVKHNGSVVVHFALLVALLAILDTAINVGSRAISARVGEGLIYDMRSKVFAHVAKMPIAFFTRTQTGALVSRLNNDVMGAQQAFTDVLQNVVSNFFTVVLVVGAMLFLSWPITLVALALLPVFILPARRVGRRLQVITRESYTLNAELTNMMTERFNVSGALLVKLFGRPAVERESFDRRAGRVRDIGITQALYSRIFFASLSLTAMLATALVYGWGGLLVVHRQLNIGTIIALTAYLIRLYGPLTSLANVQIDIMTALVSFDRVFEVLDLAPMIDEIANPTVLPRGPASIVFSHVNFSYPASDEVSLASLESVAVKESHRRVEVLEDVDFAVQPGQMVALVGHSGAGKTTISHLVSRIYDVSDGAVFIDGIDIRTASFASLRDVVGIVTQDAHLFHDTIRENLLFAKPDATEGEMREALSRAQIDELIDQLPDGLDTLVGDRGYRLSGGEKQRLAIARLLLKAPDIVVLDEATAHLDSESEAAVQRALDTALVGRTSLVIAHRLSTIRNADLILVLEQGKIVQRGRHQELLLEGGLYAELYRTQFQEPTDIDLIEGTTGA